MRGWIRTGLSAAVLTCASLSFLGVMAASPAQAARPQSAPVFAGRSQFKVRAAESFQVSVKTKANPIASIQEEGTLPYGVSFHDNGDGTATLSGTIPLSGTYSVVLDATNSVGSSSETVTLTVVSKLPPIRHVFVIMLENEDYASTFGAPANDPYLATTLRNQGALLENYYGTGHFSNDNYVSFVSGQPANSSNQADCSTYSDFPSGDGQDANGIQQGAGCVYPAAVPTVADQLAAEGLTWKGYMEDMGNDPNRESPVCGHPSIGSSDPSFVAEQGDGYATRHDPFVYFHSIIDNASVCDTRVVPLGSTTGGLPAGTPAGVTGLATDLGSVSTTPNLSFITPNLCDDGHDFPCKNQPSGASALADIDSFLSTWVPMIESSPAFKQDGLLEITFDEAEEPTLDSTACCGETPGPAADSGGNGITGPGGGRVGALLISPFITPGRAPKTPMNHFSSLASIEDLFGVARLGEAKSVTSTFDEGVYSKGRSPAVG